MALRRHRSYGQRADRTLSEIIRSVNEIRQWLPEADLSNLRLHPATPHDLEIEQPEGRTDKRGQFVMPVRPPEQNSDALFEQAQSAEETEDIAEAERLYRLLMKCDPTDAVAPFNLGNMLRVNGRKTEAEAAFRAATRADPMFAKACITFLTCWTSKADQKPRSIVCVGHCKPRRTTLMRYSISRCCFNETTSTRKLRSTGGVILPMALNPNGQHVRAGL
jgi:tetratricopeptide (TPR) repeat protein